MKTKKAAKPKKLKIYLTAVIEGEAGMADFARMLRVLQDNGFEGQVRHLVKMLVAEADKRGLAVPAELREM